MEKRITSPRKLLSMLLAIALAVAFLPVIQPQSAYAMDELTLDTPYTFITTSDNRWPSAQFTAPADGTYIFRSSGYESISPYGQLFSDSDCVSDDLILFDSYDNDGNYFKGEYYLSKGQTVYLCVWDTNEVFGSIDVTVTMGEQRDPEPLYQDYPCFAAVAGNGTVFAFEPCVSGDHTFRIYAASNNTGSLADVSAVLYSDGAMTEEVATSSSDENNTSVALTAELQLAATYYLKVTPSEYSPETYCAVVAGPSSESSLNCGNYSLATNETWYLDGNLDLHGSATLYGSDSNAVDSSQYSLQWFAVDGTMQSAPAAEGYFALVALAADDSSYSSACISYVNVLQTSSLRSCKFAEANPMIVDGKLVMDKTVIWLGDNSTVDPSVYDLVWYGEESEPATAGEHVLLANAAENSGWTGQLARIYDIHSYTSSALTLDKTNTVTVYEDGVFSFTPSKDGSYRIAVQGIDDAGYFKILAIGDRIDYNGVSAVNTLCDLEANETYYIYVDSFNNPENVHTVNVSISEHVKPGGALTLGEELSCAVPSDETGEFTFTASEAGTYSFAVKGAAANGACGFDKATSSSYNSSEFAAFNIDLAENQGATLYVNPATDDTVTVLVKRIPRDSDYTVSYQWADDGSTCTATRACAFDQALNETAEGTITSTVKSAATCTKAGTTAYTATFDEAWAENQTKDVDDIAALGHSWNSGVITKAAQPGIAGLSTYTCSSCKATKTTAIAALSLTQKVSGMTYKVTDTKTRTVTLTVGKDASAVTVPNTVTIAGASYKVTAIAKGAFAKCKKVKTVTIKSGKLTKASLKGMVKGSKIKTVKLSGAAAKKMKKTYQKWLGSTIKVR